MIILSVRTDKPEAEVGLYNDTEQLAYEMWQAHRELAETLHSKVAQLLKNQQLDWHDIQGIVAFKGPGSFTGLRIGLTIANALAYSLEVPAVAQENPNWLEEGITRLLAGEKEQILIPEYGAPVHITAPKR